MKKIKIAYQGIPGSYSSEAVHYYADELQKEVESISFNYSEEVLTPLLNNEVDLAILPIENSIAGPVNMNMDLLIKYPLIVIEEIYLPIHHHLLANKGECLESIKRVLSHPVALAQCHPFLKNYNMTPIPEYDTAGACKIISKDRPPGIAAIASKKCAEVYGLEILCENIQEERNNITRFFVLSSNRENLSLDQDKCSLAFKTLHLPGALLDCLEVFKKYGLNLTRLESRPIPQNPFQYTFFVDCLQNYENPSALRMALQELEEKTSFIQIFGSYANKRANENTP